MAEEEKQFKGNNTEAYDGHCIEVEIEADSEEELAMVSKLEFVTGCIRKTYTMPKTKFFIDFTTEESLKLDFKNIGYLVSYDYKGRIQQCLGFIEFLFYDGVIKEC